MDVEARAAAFAALAEPARLRIVDLLSASDASPSELRDTLGVPSNLLAHHLGVLEARGIVRRHRSHAARRRTYLRLHPDAMAGLLPGAAAAESGHPVERVVFVCTANSARSQLANALWQEASAIPSTCAGTHPAKTIASGAVAVARRRGLHLVQDKPHDLDGLLRAGDFAVTVCDGAHEELAMTPADGLAGVIHWSVPDPVPAGTAAAFDNAYDEIADRVAELAPRLASSMPSPDTSAAS